MAMDLEKPASDMHNTTSEPLVAVWVLTYNHEAFVERALLSILEQQTSFKVKIFVCDDCSKDATALKIKQIQDRNPEQIHFIANDKNIGPTKNAFLQYERCFQSGAKYIAMLEGDDFWDDPKKLQIQVDHLEQHPETCVVWHDYTFIDQAGLPLDPAPLKGSLRNYTKQELRKITSIKTLTVCYRNVMDSMPQDFFNCPNGDTFLFSMLGQFGGATFLPQISPAKYRVHHGGLWSETKSRQRDLLALKSYLSIAGYYAQLKDSETVNYYIDRYIKTNYLISFEDKSANKYFAAFKTFFVSLWVLLRFKYFKTIPHVIAKFAQIIIMGKEVKWALREPQKV
jgi:glycosyltransferase involved in cell wall biosynthesis